MKGKNGRQVSCEWVALHLDAYLDDELDQKQAEQMRTHLCDCPSCAARAKEAEELLTLVAACDDVVPDPSVHESIMGVLGNLPQAQPTPACRPKWRRIGAPLVGACLLLALILIPPAMKNPSAPLHDPTVEAPDMDDGSGNKPSSPDDEAEPPAHDSPEYDAPSCDSPGYDDPTDPSAPPDSEEPGGKPQEPDSGIEGEDEEAKNVYVLYRQTPASSTEDVGSLWDDLSGEWLGENVSLFVSAEDHMVQFSDETKDIWAGAELIENRLILNPNTDEMINFWVRLDGDTLWLTTMP